MINIILRLIHHRRRGRSPRSRSGQCRYDRDLLGQLQSRAWTAFDATISWLSISLCIWQYFPARRMVPNHQAVYQGRLSSVSSQQRQLEKDWRIAKLSLRIWVSFNIEIMEDIFFSAVFHGGLIYVLGGRDEGASDEVFPVSIELLSAEEPIIKTSAIDISHPTGSDRSFQVKYHSVTAFIPWRTQTRRWKNLFFCQKTLRHLSGNYKRNIENNSMIIQ